MLTLRPLLRLTRQRNGIPSRSFVRIQHNSHGPHKEYFQNPNRQYYPNSSTPNPTYEDQHKQKTGTTPSRTRRFIRTSLWALVFFFSGALAAESLLTWDYLTPPYETGSEEEQEFQDEINELLDTCSLVEELRKNGWKEESMLVRPGSSTSPNGEHLIHQTLKGTQGITMRFFRLPVSHFSILVFIPGFGCEGWPDVIHGGAISSIILEAAKKHVEGSTKYIVQEEVEQRMDFRHFLKPGGIYAIICSAPKVIAIPRGQRDDYQLYLDTQAWLVRTDTAPKFEFETDPTTSELSTIVHNYNTTIFATARVAHRVLPTAESNLKVLRETQSANDMERLGAKMLAPIENVKPLVGTNVLNLFGAAAMQGKFDSEKNSQKPSDTGENPNSDDKAD